VEYRRMERASRSRRVLDSNAHLMREPQTPKRKTGKKHSISPGTGVNSSEWDAYIRYSSLIHTRRKEAGTGSRSQKIS
jgi:hypothetical protein